MARSPKPNRAGNRRSRVAKSAVSVLELHVQGYTFREIGEQLGFSKQHAHSLYKREMAENAALRKELAGLACEYDLAVCERLLKALNPRIEKGDPKAVTAAVRVLQRRGALLGIDAPRRTEITGADGVPLNKPEERTPEAIHARLGAIAARAVDGADSGATEPPESERA